MPSNEPRFTPEQVETIHKAIAHRRSMGIARLSPQPVEREVLEAAFEAANWAPSHGDTEPWRFIVYQGEAIHQLAEIFADAYKFAAEAEGKFKQETYEAQIDRALSSPTWIAIIMQPGLDDHGNLKMPLEEELMATACAVQNMHLSLCTQGVVGMWHSKGVSVHPYTAEQLGINAPARLLGFFFAGYPNQTWAEGERGPVHEKVTWA